MEFDIHISVWSISSGVSDLNLHKLYVDENFIDHLTIDQLYGNFNCLKTRKARVMQLFVI